MRLLCVAIAIASAAFLTTIVSGESLASRTFGLFPETPVKNRKGREISR